MKISLAAATGTQTHEHKKREQQWQHSGPTGTRADETTDYYLSTAF